MNTKPLNVVWIGPQSFPIGNATSKRRRYMVDYMNTHDIQSHYLCCDFKQYGERRNATEGIYGLCDYKDITPIADEKRFLLFWKEGKRQLLSWYREDHKNVLIFSTILRWSDYPFYKYALKIGYHIVFDQLETSFLGSGYNSFLRKLNLRFSERLSDRAFKKCPAFVISQALLKENRERYPNRKLCLLQNSTPVISDNPKTSINTPLQVLYSGTFGAKDGVEYMIDGIIKAHDRNIACNLILLGKGQPQDMAVLEKTKGLDYISYLGYVTDQKLSELLTQADVLCMTRTNSRFANYGFPFKLSEYLATGNIVLATNVGDVHNYLENAKSAYIVPPENADAIADAIEHIVNNPDEALLVARGGFKAMQEHFSIEKVGKKFIDFLNLI